jgi:hypothetical protein
MEDPLYVLSVEPRFFDPEHPMMKVIPIIPIMNIDNVFLIIL